MEQDIKLKLLSKLSGGNRDFSEKMEVAGDDEMASY